MSTEVRRPNRRGEGTLLRRDILDAAASILDDTPNEAAVTLRAVARRAGIAAPSIFAHFADRQAILLALVQEAFAELAAQLRDVDPQADPVRRLRATGEAYLAYAAAHPQRYRLMFGGVWDGGAAVTTSTVTAAEVTGLGRDALEILTDRLQACVDDGSSTGTDVHADVVALWLGLHGLAHQRAVASAFPWPADITERVVAPLARLRPGV